VSDLVAFVTAQAQVVTMARHSLRHTRGFASVHHAAAVMLFVSMLCQSSVSCRHHLQTTAIN
jgi:hypothetical protein